MRNSECRNHVASGDASDAASGHQDASLKASSSSSNHREAGAENLSGGNVVVADDVDGYDEEDDDDEDGDDEYVNISVRRDEDCVAEAAQVRLDQRF